MKNQQMKFAEIPLMAQILRSPRWLAMVFLLPLLAMVHFAMAAPIINSTAIDPSVTQAPAAEKFEHAKIGYNLSGAHIAARCTSCHINNVFKGTPRDCATCHLVGNHMGATAKPTNHVATNVQCDSCHKSTLWTPAFFSHVGIATGTCGTCHNGINAKGKADSAKPHPLTALDCSSCHTTISFVGAASVLPTNHLPTTQACSLCHAIGYGEGSGVMNHAGITSNCNSCHNGQTFAVGMTPKTKQYLPTHITTTLDCSSCHISTNSFTGATMTVLPAGHFPTAQPCVLCHAAGYGANQGVMNHVGIANNCIQCHNGQTFAVGAQPKFKPAGPLPHVPTTASCETCHSASQTNSGGFLITTLPMMNHAGITSNCNTCHNGQIFAGVTPKRKQDAATTHVNTTKDCSVCHNSTNTFVGAVGELPTGHLVSAQPCALCHVAGYGTGSGAMSHAGITNNCASCHSNQTFAVGMKPKSKSTNHIPTTSVPNGTACETCHAISQTSAGGFTSAPMNHAGIATGCASCHGGTAYAGAPLAKSVVNHIPTTAMTNGAKCETCHATNQTNTGGFLVGVQMKHTGIANNCVACHGDTKNYPGATRMKDAIPAHYATTLDCSSCHTSVTTFKGASVTVLPTGHLVTSQACSLCHAAGYGAGSGVMNHFGIINNCASCHNGQTFAVGMKPKSKSAAHFPTTAVSNGAVCETCHLATNTNVGGFDLGTMNHAGVTTCLSCHNDGLTYAGSPKRKQDDPTPPHVATALDCKACHTGTITFTGASGGAMPANHIATAQPCTLCHAAGYSLTLTVMNHLGITTGCANCHNGQTFVGPQTPMKKPTNHIPYAANLLGGSGMQCEFCHKLTNAFTLNVTSTVMHNGSKGKGSGQCTGCHLSGTSYLAVQGRKSLTHDSPGHTDCSDSGCHKPLGNQGTAYSSW